MCLCVSALCLSVCVGSESQLLVFARWKRLLRMSVSPQQSCCSCLAYTVLVRPDVCLRCVMEQQDVAVSQQVPVSHTHWESCVSRTRRPPPVFVFMKKNVCTSAHESLRSVSSHLCLKQPSPTHPLRVYVNISSSFFLLTTVISHSPRFPSFALFHSSYNLLLFSHRLFTYSLSSRHILPLPYLFSFFLVTPPSPPPFPLLLLSRPSWGVQWDGNGRAVWCGVFVCVMSHYSSSIVALSFLIPMLTDHTAILRFYKPFQRSFDGESLSAYCAPSVFGEKEWACEFLVMVVCF